MSSSERTQPHMQRKLKELQQQQQHRAHEPLRTIVSTLSQLATVEFASRDASFRSATLRLPAFGPKGHSTELNIDTRSEVHFDVDSNQTRLEAWWRMEWMDAPAALKPADVQLQRNLASAAGEPEPSVLGATLLEWDHSGFAGQPREENEDSEARAIVAVAPWLAHAGVLERVEEWEEMVRCPRRRGVSGSPAVERALAGARLIELLFDVVQVDYSFCCKLDGEFLYGSKYLKPNPTEWRSMSGHAADSPQPEEEEKDPEELEGASDEEEEAEEAGDKEAENDE